MIGFVHTADEFHGTGNPEGKSYKSVALACSHDYGVTWTHKGRILTLGEKPVEPAWSGTGDQVTFKSWGQTN